MVDTNPYMQQLEILGQIEERSMIEAVFEYFDNSYAQEYAEAAALISRGMITIYHMGKLFHPNQLLVYYVDESYTRLEDRAVYVLSEWAVVNHAELKLRVWNWYFNGYTCQRRDFFIFFQVPVEDEAEPFPINKLITYPASFLGEESLELIRKRGKNFWSLRRPILSTTTRPYTEIAQIMSKREDIW